MIGTKMTNEKAKTAANPNPKHPKVLRAHERKRIQNCLSSLDHHPSSIISFGVNRSTVSLDNEVDYIRIPFILRIHHHSQSWPRNRDHNSARKGRPWEPMDRRKEQEPMVVGAIATPSFLPRITPSRTPPSPVSPSLTMTSRVRTVIYIYDDFIP